MISSPISVGTRHRYSYVVSHRYIFVLCLVSETSESLAATSISLSWFCSTKLVIRFIYISEDNIAAFIIRRRRWLFDVVGKPEKSLSIEWADVTHCEWFFLQKCETKNGCCGHPITFFGTHPYTYNRPNPATANWLTTCFVPENNWQNVVEEMLCYVTVNKSGKGNKRVGAGSIGRVRVGYLIETRRRILAEIFLLTDKRNSCLQVR